VWPKTLVRLTKTKFGLFVVEVGKVILGRFVLLAEVTTFHPSCYEIVGSVV